MSSESVNLFGFCCGKHLSSKTQKTVDHIFCSELLLSAICYVSEKELLPPIFEGFKDKIVLGDYAVQFIHKIDAVEWHSQCFSCVDEILPTKKKGDY